MLNPASSSTEVIEPSRVCGAPFYVYAGPNNNVLVEAPGFVVESRRFKNMVVPRLEPSSMPERVGRGGVELSLRGASELLG